MLKSVNHEAQDLSAILNLQAAQWYFEQLTTPSDMGTNRWKKYKIAQLPVPVLTKKEEPQIETPVNQTLMPKQNPARKESKDTTALEAKIDHLMCALYGLTQVERLDGSTPRRFDGSTPRRFDASIPMVEGQ